MGMSTSTGVGSRPGRAVEVSIACDLDDNADHYVYADPE